MLRRIPFITLPLTAGAAAVAAILILQVLRTGGLPDPTGHGDFGARVLDIAVLVFREGLEQVIPGWMGLWFAVFPTVETLAAQILAAAIVVGSFVLARPQGRALQAGSA